MLVTVFVPSVLRALCDGEHELVFELPDGASVDDLLGDLADRAPGVHARIVDEQGAVRRHVNVFVGDESIRALGGVATVLADQQEIRVIPAVSGG